MSLTFDTQKAVQELRERGVEESAAEGMVEVVTDATSGLLTQEYFDARLQAEIQGVRGEIQGVRAEFSHALLVLGLGLAGLMVGVAGVSLAAAALLFD